MAEKYGEIVRQIYLDFEANHDIEGEKAMAGILLDGLKYGNWPWSEAPKVGDAVLDSWMEHHGPRPSSNTGTWGPWGPEGRQGN